MNMKAFQSMTNRPLTNGLKGVWKDRQTKWQTDMTENYLPADYVGVKNVRTKTEQSNLMRRANQNLKIFVKLLRL